MNSCTSRVFTSKPVFDVDRLKVCWLNGFFIHHIHSGTPPSRYPSLEHRLLSRYPSREGRRSARDTYRESYITKYTSIRCETMQRIGHTWSGGWGGVGGASLCRSTSLIRKCLPPRTAQGPRHRLTVAS
jgi:hypothetical protein